jgi:hypothetical protein
MITDIQAVDFGPIGMFEDDGLQARRLRAAPPLRVAPPRWTASRSLMGSGAAGLRSSCPEPPLPVLSAWMPQFANTVQLIRQTS